MQRKDMRLTEGAVWKNIILFALPLMIGNLFQQLYNTVDSIIVGNFIGKEALAAVGSVDSIINTFIGFFSGLSAGAGVVISQYYGAKDDESVHKAVHSTIALTLILSVIITALATLTTPFFLKLLGTPRDVWESSETYLGIYFLGSTGLLVYNMGSGILRAAGDSKRPLYFLIFSTIVNITLDIIFIAVFDMGIAGAAWATVIAEFLSALLVLIVLSAEKDCYKIVWSKIRIDFPILKKILSVGIPTAIQMMITAFSNVLVQSYINFFGSAAMAGWSSYSKIDKICLLPLQSIGLAITTFIGQNIGAGERDRAIEGIKVATKINVMISITVVAFLWIFAPYLVLLFSKDEDVIRYGTLFLRLLGPFFICVGFNQIHNGALKGAGNSKIPMIIMMSSFILFRQVYLFLITKFANNVYTVALGYPLGWLLCTIILAIYYKHVDISKFSVVDAKAKTKAS